MSTVTDADDPVQAVVDICSAAATAWPNDAVPDRIQPMEDSTPSQRLGDQRRSDISLYVARVADGDFNKVAAAGGLDQTYLVDVVILHHDSDTVDAYRRAVLELFAGFASDNGRRTPYIDIFPDSDTDDRAGNYESGQFAIEAVTVRLRKYDDLGATRL